ncbi:alternative ribosome rescue aminoacyl-tRNA hydrolase ArfB [Kocuria palustris]|uniref:alternative ribosome rescue aminoacyl-tRNA hydrolase ArfB n=1 Tax=Kocuria palustris TaxID=71999 RepID=UPI0011A6FB4F|nr:alternative ribosome rescue aminoacyl-tRNA hydrolase ArfB [Kocuria palustris]
MEDLRIPPGPGIPRGLVVPAAELDERFTRSSGPGGQSVNTTDTRVRLRLDLASCTALTDDQRRRAMASLRSRLRGSELAVEASEHRSQLRNRKAARQRMAELLREALAPPAPQRRPTKPTRGSQRRRLRAKKVRSGIKAARKQPGPDA